LAISFSSVKREYFSWLQSDEFKIPSIAKICGSFYKNNLLNDIIINLHAGGLMANIKIAMVIRCEMVLFI
jgi:hypothetical protein